MPYCPHCGALVAEDATICRNCGASLQPQQLGVPQSSQSPQPAMSKPFQSEAPASSPSSSAASTKIPSNVSAELSQRLEKALKRTELLSYAAIGLAVVILIVTILVIY